MRRDYRLNDDDAGGWSSPGDGVWIHIWEERTVHGVDKDLDVGGGHLVWVGF